MIDLVELFENKKIKSIEFYRSERFGNDNEEIWCEIDLLSTDWYPMTIYRKGCVVTSSGDRLGESALTCLLNGRELAFKTSHFSDSKTRVCETKVWRDQVCELVRSVSINMDVMHSMNDCSSPFMPSKYYPERKIKCSTDKNRVSLNFTDGTGQFIEMHLDSNDRMYWPRDLKVVPQLYRCFIGPYTIKKISKEHLTSAEVEEFEFICACTLYAETDIEFILDHLFRDENGEAYYAIPDGTECFRLYGTS